jgi:ribokinase
MIGNVGRDPFGAILLESLRAAGVDVSGVETVSGGSGTASILVLPGGENSIVISPGANEWLTAHEVAARMRRLKVRIVLCQLEVPIEATECALGEARKAGAVTILDPAPARPLSAAILSQVDYLTPNQTEALALLDRQREPIDTVADAKSAARKLLALGLSNVILKIGRLGCVLATRDETQALTGFDVDAVDTTGAGDVFNGAFAASLAEGRPARERAMIANAAAAISVTRVGAQSSIPSRREVEHLLQTTASLTTGSELSDVHRS